MNGFFDMVLSQLEAGLDGLNTEPNLIRRLDGSVKLVKKAISGLKAELGRDPFVGREQEIVYFREQAPLIYSRLFYFLKLRLLEAHRTNLSPGSFRRELEKEMSRIEDFYERHRQLLQSTCGDDAFWDGCLYTRRGCGDWWAEEEGLYIDEDFTIGCYWVAKTMANEALQKWLLEQLDSADAPVTSAAGTAAKPELRFTGKKVYLLEWVLGIHLSGCLNDGKLTFKDTIERFQEFLHIDLGDYDVGIQEMARRKISVTKFTDFVLEKLKEKLGGMG
jgi:hypothetical protein